jgi:hypothetical protein
MKKLFALLLVAGALFAVACGNTEEAATEETTMEAPVEEAPMEEAPATEEVVADTTAVEEVPAQ